MSLQPPRDKRVSLADAASLVSDGAIVALGGGLSARLPMALVRELIRQDRRGLHLVGSAHSIDVDLLVAAGAVRRCEESYVGFEQDLGLAPAYRRAAEEGTIEVAESCCATILAQLRAAEMGVPFLPVRGVRGSDIATLHPEYAEITCPFTGETLVAVPALRPDVALLHAPSGDRYGNLHLEQPYVLDERFASASRMVIATVDELVSTEELTACGVTIPGHLVAATVEAPFGAHPTSCYPRYAYDRDHLREYVSAAQSGPDDLDKYLATYVSGSEESYREADRRRASRRAGRLVGVHHRMAGAVRMSWTIDEWFVIALARTIRPAETVFHGFGSPCAQVAMHVARRTHAPDMLLVEGAMYAINPDPPFIPPTSNDASLSRGAAYSMRFEEFFDAAIRGDVDRMFLSGGQIDGYGNTNVTAIGPARPAEGQAGRGRRRLQPVRHDRPADRVDHPAPVRAHAGPGVRLHHRHGPPHPARHPGGTRLHRRRPAVAGHRAGRLRFPRRPGPAGAGLPRCEPWPRSTRRPASRWRPPATCVPSRRRHPRSWPRSARWTRWGCASPSSPPASSARVFEHAHGQDCAC